MDTLTLFLIGIGVAVLVAVIIWAADTPTYSTSTFNLNLGGTILTINATFYGNPLASPYFKHYIINNATEELPNGTIIHPAKSYVEAAIAATCTTASNQLYIGNGNYYSC
jgi:hypothetical protein